MSAPSVYQAINAITAEFANNGIPKTRTNQSDNYKYRSIDDLLDRLGPLLASHRLCVLPCVLDRHAQDRVNEQGGLLVHVAVRASFTLISVDDATSHEVASYGEALDSGDKATAKAMSAAYKTAMIQSFCIPVGGEEDADACAHRLKTQAPEPVQGWTQWCLDIQDIVGLCESEEAITLVQDRNRQLLTALSRDQPDRYKALGQMFASRREALTAREDSPKKAEPTLAKRRRRKTGELQNA